MKSPLPLTLWAAFALAFGFCYATDRYVGIPLLWGLGGLYLDRLVLVLPAAMLFVTAERHRRMPWGAVGLVIAGLILGDLAWRDGWLMQGGDDTRKIVAGETADYGPPIVLALALLACAAGWPRARENDEAVPAR